VVLTDLDADLAGAAITAVRHLSPRHLADALISAAARQAGARQLLTADRTFASQLVPVVQLGDCTAPHAIARWASITASMKPVAAVTTELAREAVHPWPTVMMAPVSASHATGVDTSNGQSR
jgi:hypothetical protein